MSEALFKQINDKLDGFNKTNDTLLRNYESLSVESKKAMEEFTKTKNALEDQGKIIASMQKLYKHLSLERRTAWGSPSERVAADENLRTIVQLNLINDLKLWEYVGSKTKDRLEGFRKDLDGGNAPGSGYIANAEVEKELYDLLATYGAFRNLDARTIGARSTDIRLKTARAVATFVDEAAAVGADSAKAGSKVTVTPKKVGCLLSVSSELLEDDVAGVIADVMDDMAEAHAFRADWISFAADGGADEVDGGFTGMFEGGTARTAASGNVSMATLDYEDWLACIVNAPTAVLQRGNGKWYINQNMLAKAMYIKDGNGRPIFLSAVEAPAYGSIGTILGFPVVPVAAAPSTDGAGKLVAAFGDGKGLGVRIRRDYGFERSDQFAFNTDEITFRSLSRIAAKVKAATAFQVLKTAAS